MCDCYSIILYLIPANINVALKLSLKPKKKCFSYTGLVHTKWHHCQTLRCHNIATTSRTLPPVPSIFVNKYVGEMISLGNNAVWIKALRVLNILNSFPPALLSSAHFFKINFFKKFFQEYHLSVNHVGSRSGLTTSCRAWSGSKLFAKVISRQH